ncbi:MAG TPA: hypothetical protein VGG39_23795 [Polyangiaceae bacterium]|jgi:hypothetical protein
MAARVSRVGFFAYALIAAAGVAANAWQRHVIDEAVASKDWSRADSLLHVLTYADVAMSLATVVALVAIGRAPRRARAGGLAIAAAILEGVTLLLSIGERVLLSSWVGSGRLVDDFVTAASGVATIVYLAATAVLFVACLRIARAARGAGMQALSHVAVAGLTLAGARVVVHVVAVVLREHAWKSEVFSAVSMGAYYAGSAVLVGTAIAAGIAVGRIPDEEAALAPPPTDALPRAWGGIAGGIGLYLGAAGARVFCALLGYGVLAGASGASGYGGLRQVRDGVIVVAALSAVATLAMFAGVWRIARAPTESNGGGPALAALGFMGMGFVFDLVSTGITADALGGSVSAAFFAMDALPVVAFFSGVLGVGAAVSLLRAFGNIARAIGHGELVSRARATTVLAASTGGLLCLAILGLTRVPAELLLVVAVVALPLAVATLVQFLRVAVPLGQSIRARVAT